MLPSRKRGRSVERISLSLSTLLGLAILSGGISAQETGTLEGQVAEGQGGVVLPGVQIVLPELGLEATTDEDGRFRLAEVPAGNHDVVAEILGCSWVSRTVHLREGETEDVNFILGPRAIALDGILVTGVAPGVPLQLSFTVEALEGAGLHPEIAGNVGDLLRGRMAGGRVLQGSGLPGEEADILLRGSTSIGGAQQRPLVVVDGIVVGHSTAGIDPMDVERVQVLKGAAAAAEYGSRAHAGVIEVTTKRRPGEPAPQDPEPILIVDGTVTDGRVGDLDTREIAEIKMIRGPTAILAAGLRGHAGIISVTTLRALDQRPTPVCPADLLQSR